MALDGDLATDLVEQPGANRLAPTLGDVFAPFTNQRGHRVGVALLQPRRHLAVDPETLGGYSGRERHQGHVAELGRLARP